MAPTMRPCPGCGRHVKISEGQCPFCATAFPQEWSQFAHPTTNKRLSRAAIAAFGATLALTGCAASTSPTNDGGADSATQDSAQQTDTGVVEEDSGIPIAAYGLPPQDGGVAPPYGIPPRDE